MAIALPAPWATASDLADYWRPLTDAEQAKATTLLGWAAQLLSEAAGADDFDPVVCAQVSMDMVKRAMINGTGVSEVTSSQEMADMTASTSARYVNPMGTLYLTSQELARLQGRPAGGAAASITLSSNARVPGQPWNHQPSTQTDAAAD